MGLTKLGRLLLQLPKEVSDDILIKCAENKFLKYLDTINRGIYPALTTFNSARDIFSGDESVGGSLGALAGSTAAFYGVDSFIDKHMKNPLQPKTAPKGIFNWIPKPSLKGITRFVVPAIASVPADMIGGYIGNKIIPYRRNIKPEEYQMHYTINNKSV